MREIANANLARGETPFLPAFADNHDAIELFEKLGFATRRDPVLIVLQKSRRRFFNDTDFNCRSHIAAEGVR